MAANNDHAYSLQIGDYTFTVTGFAKLTEGADSYCLHGIRFNRKIYQPGEIEAEISMKPKPSVTDAISMLLQKNVTLEMNGKTVAENYYVHEILPQEKKDVNDQLFIKVSIFSKDKLMTLDKYSKVYVAKKLGSEILDVERKNFTPDNATPINVDFAHMRMLKYTHTRSLTNNMTGKTINIQIPSEFIHPYLVQYNETFYDFMIRTANRCGEFLYFEDGQLNLGLPTGDAPIVIKNYLSVTYQNISAGPLDVNSFARDSMKDGAGIMEGTNYDVVRKNAAGYPHDAFPSRLSYNSELAQDEYFFPLYADKFSTFTREMGLAGDAGDAASTQIFPLLNQLLSDCDDYASFLVGFGIEEGMNIKNSISTASSTNESGFSKYIDIKGSTDRAKKLEQGDGKTNAVPFGTLSPEGWTTLDYYRDVRRYEEEQQLKMICIDMGTDYADVKLGSKIRLTEKGDQYTVVQILMVNGSWNHSYVKYDSVETPKVKTMQNQKIFAIPDREKKSSDRENTNLAYPPVLNVPIVRKAEPQTAFIADNDDPKYQGRVRIVYPWQTGNEGELKALAQAESEYAKAQEALAEKKKELTELEAELKALKNELGDLQWINSDLEQDTTLRKKMDTNDIYSSIIGERELEKNEDIKKLDDEIDKNQKALEKEKKKDKGKQDAKLIKSLETEIMMAQEKRQDLEVIQKENDKYINHLKRLEDNPAELKKRMKEIEDALDGKRDGSKQKAYKDTKTAIKDAEKDLKAKKENVDKKSKDAKDALVMISSPWVRITTPMATEGGGTFFKPRVGDEVLVSYENGNVERPYVIGSLFSKNVLAPDERINRTIGPNLHANASIAIVSPNGHGITFKDPSSGDGFISGVYPGLGVVTDFISKVPMPHTKDLAGGIKIGDRYGLYSISMSSDERSVSISSSMGKVTMNAFTGITISAPNGDVKIVGKNVSISAGNKLSLTSGTNIQGAGYEYKRDTKLGLAGEFITEKLANVSSVVDKFVTPFIDTTLARAALEVFLRPIEGTLCVKSKRYLTLEAGSGKAIVKPDRFKDYDADKTDKENDFFKRMIDCLTFINSKFDNYSDTYNNLWKDAYGKNFSVAIMAATSLVDPKDPDILKECVHKALGEDQEEFGKDFFDNKLKEHKKQADIKEDLLKRSNSLAKSVYALIDHVVSIDSLSDVTDAKPTFIENTMKEIIDATLTEMQTEWKSLYLTATETDPSDKFLSIDEPSDLYTKDTYLKRKMAALFIMKVAMHPEQVPMQFIETKYFLKGEKYEAKLTEDNLTDNYWWSKFAMNFEGKFFNTVLRTLVDNTLGAAIDSVKENLESLNPIDSIASAPKGTGLKDRVKSLKDRINLKDRDVWAAGKGGQILFSDQKDATLNFDGGDLKKEDYANCYNIDKMKKVLSGM